MLLLQSSSNDSAGFFLVIQLILRIVGAFVCSNKAKELNREPAGWGIFGFLVPIVAMIWVYCMKPKGGSSVGSSGSPGSTSGNSGYQGGYDGGHNNPGSGYNSPSNMQGNEDYKDGDLYK
jgi:hypothetical protein